MRDIETLRSFALGGVDGPRASWRAFAFDLRTVRDPIVSGTAALSLLETWPAVTLCLGYDGDEVLQRVQVSGNAGSKRLRVTLGAAVLAALNSSRGAVLYLDAWIDGGARCEIQRFDLAVTAVDAAAEMAA